MEGSTRRQARILKVKQGFECSRLEHAVLALAYRQVVPGIPCQLPARRGDTHRGQGRSCNPQQPVAKGA
jgi:hypothetical protein